MERHIIDQACFANLCRDKYAGWLAGIEFTFGFQRAGRTHIKILRRDVGVVQDSGRDSFQQFNIGFATAGVAWYVFTNAAFPWVGIAVAVSFAGYGLMRKQMHTNAIPGLLVEILLLLPFTLALVVWLEYSGRAVFLNLDMNTDLLLILGGPITIIPLAFFTAGTRLLPMATVGILFYVTPSLQFLSGIFLLGEPFNLDKLIAFGGIWIGLAIFSFSLLRRGPSAPPATL